MAITIETNRDYESIERPYNTYLERSDLGVSDSGQSQNNINNTSDIQAGNSLTNNPGATETLDGTINNGSVETQPVKSDGGMADLWIVNMIRSTSWKPKKVGFYIDGQSGYAEFTNVYVSGNIEALTGHIGGFVIEANYISDVANSFGLASTVTAGDDVRFWAGDTYANRATADFRVTEAGVVTATSGTIGGWTLSSTSLSAGTDADYIGLIPGTGIQMGDSTFADAEFSVTNAGVLKAISGTIGGCTLAATSIGSTVFVSGPLGSGWNISNTGVAEFQNVTVRGIIRTSVFEKDTISAVNGMVLVSKADVLASDMTAADNSTLVISGETVFVNNEVVRIKDGTDDEWMLVTDASGAPTYIVTRDLAGSYGANANPIWKKGTAVVSMGVGTGTKTGFVLLDSTSANSPFIDIYGRNSNTYTDYTLHGRFGWLKGITDADVGLATTDVWGLYTDNAYIKGAIVATSGKIGTSTNYWSIGATGITATSASTDVVIKYGKTDFGQDSTAGFILGYDFSATTSKFEIGASASKLFKYDGTDFSLIGGTITGGTFQTATSGRRVEIAGTSGAVTFYDAANGEIGRMGGDPASYGFITATQNTSSSQNLLYLVKNPGTTDSVGVASLNTQGKATGQCLILQNDSTETRTGIYILDIANTGTGGGIRFSDSSNSEGIPLSITMSKTTNTNAAIKIASSAVTSTNFKKILDLAGTIIWKSDGTTPNGNLSGTAGDVCVGADSGKSYYCTGTTNWTAM